MDRACQPTWMTDLGKKQILRNTIWLANLTDWHLDICKIQLLHLMHCLVQNRKIANQLVDGGAVARRKKAGELRGGLGS